LICFFVESLQMQYGVAGEMPEVEKTEIFRGDSGKNGMGHCNRGKDMV
jgi:hypothetical protein